VSAWSSAAACNEQPAARRTVLHGRARQAQRASIAAGSGRSTGRPVRSRTTSRPAVARPISGSAPWRSCDAPRLRAEAAGWLAAELRR
jgi:hypothetical protein